MFSYENLKNLRLERGYSQTFIAQQLQLSRAAYSSWETGIYVPSAKNLQALADFFGVDTAYFESEYEIIPKYLRLNQDNQNKLLQLADRLYKTQLTAYRVHAKLSAGLGQFYDEDYLYDQAFFDKTIAYDIASWVEGDSMEPQYPNGNVALIQNTGFSYNGLVYAVVHDDELFIKKVYIEGDTVRLVSLNKKYKDILIPADSIRIIGPVTDTFKPIEVSE